MLPPKPKQVRSLVIHNVPTQFYVQERSHAIVGAAGRRFIRRHDEMVEISKDTLPSTCYDRLPADFFGSGEEAWKPFVNACLRERIFTHVVR